MKKSINILFRFIVCPFVMGVIGIACIRLFLLSIYFFLRYGGEFVTFRKDFIGTTITESLEKVLENQEGINIVDLEAERNKWSLETFTDATAMSSLTKAQKEINEIAVDIHEGRRNPTEYADVLMCLFDSGARQKVPIYPPEMFRAFRNKLNVNKNRDWKKNHDNTYSHIK